MAKGKRRKSGRRASGSHARVIKKGSTHILLLDRDDPEKELEFEIGFQLSLTERQRYEIMDGLVRDGLARLREHGHKTAPKISVRS